MTRRLPLLAAATLVTLGATLVTGSQVGAASDGAADDRVAADSSWGPRPGKPGRG